MYIITITSFQLSPSWRADTTDTTAAVKSSGFLCASLRNCFKVHILVFASVFSLYLY